MLTQPALALMVDLGPVPGAPGNNVVAQGISPDGSTVVGQAGNLWDNQLFRWSRKNGYSKIGPVFARPFTYALATSRSGELVVGAAPLIAGSSNLRAFGWAQGEELTDLGTLGGASSGAYSINNGGPFGVDLAVAGFAENAAGIQRAFRWTKASGMLDLGSLPGSQRSFAFGISGDGKVVVGFSGTIYLDSKAFRWDVASSSMVDLGSLGGTSVAYATNYDGSVVVGYSFRTLSNLSVRETAFRWTAATGMQGIGKLSGDDSTRSIAKAVNDDGSVVVGTRGGRAFRWTSRGGLVDLGVLPGDSYSEATGVSADGNVVVGRSSGTGFRNRAFIWTADKKPMQDLSSLQQSLIRSAARITRLFSRQGLTPPLPGILPVNAATADAGTDINLGCAALLTTDCAAAPTRPWKVKHLVASS